MKNIIYIPTKDRKSRWKYNLDFYQNWYLMHVEEVCVINARKDHNHSYYVEYFFYDTKALGHNTFKSKSELHNAILKLIKENVK